MQESPITAIGAIQAILAPALGISAVGLLLLGLLNRYSGMVSRIRLLNDEKRKLTRLFAAEKEPEYPDRVRFASVRKQTDELIFRSRLVRNAILSMEGAIGMFVLASLGIGLNLFISGDALRTIPLILFMGGMVGVLTGIVFTSVEVHRSFKIVLIEVMSEE
jgi:hypothetical protein